jgi:hypothetical protein
MSVYLNLISSSSFFFFKKKNLALRVLCSLNMFKNPLFTREICSGLIKLNVGKPIALKER